MFEAVAQFVVGTASAFL